LTKAETGGSPNGSKISTRPAAKITIALARMELGNFSRVKAVGSGVFEFKIDFGPGYRIYFGRDGDRLVILIGGGTKKRQQTGYRGGEGMLDRVQTKEKTGDSIMPLTHDFKETIRARARLDADFRQALLREAIECFLNGDLATGKAVLRDYVNATVGFQYLEKRTQIPAKSLMRMLGPKGSPSAANLSNILTALQKTEGVRFELSLRS
jgi:putative addiction module killer protein